MNDSLQSNNEEEGENDKDRDEDVFVSQEEIRRKQVDELRSRIDGNRLGPRDKTPPRRVEAEREKRQDKDKRRRSSVYQEDEEYRTERRRREEQARKNRGSRTRSLSPARAPPAVMSPWSAVGKMGRPEGYTRDQVNAMGVAPALQIAGWQREEDRQREAIIAKPGKRETIPSIHGKGAGPGYPVTQHSGPGAGAGPGAGRPRVQGALE